MSFYPTFPRFPRISGYGRPLGPSGQPQSLTAHRAIGKQSVGRVEALEPGRLPDIPRIPDGWDQGRLLSLSSTTVYRAPEIGGARFSGSPIEVGFRRSAAAGLRNKLRGSRRSALGQWTNPLSREGGVEAGAFWRWRGWGWV